MWRRGRVLIVAVAALSLGACAARGRAAAPETRPEFDQVSLETYIQKVRAVSGQALARPMRNAPVTVESWDKELAAALLAAMMTPGPDSEKAVAREYLRLKVPDRAARHLTRAVQMDPKDSEAYEGLAQIWRDAGFPNLALGDSYRAVYYAPRSAAAQNTLGTVLLRLGLTSEAIGRFDRAFELDRSASYALNNACYAWLIAGEFAKAAAACERTVEITPDLSAARNNLAIAYAAVGNFDAAGREFGAKGDEASAQYNLGVVSLAARRFGEAASAFDAAARLRPGFRLAHERAVQARRLAAESPDQGDPR